MLNSKAVYCQKPEHEYSAQTLCVSPEYGTDRLYLSIWRGQLHCSTTISKDEARELADAILELLEDIGEPNPGQHSIVFAQEGTAA